MLDKPYIIYTLSKTEFETISDLLDIGGRGGEALFLNYGDNATELLDYDCGTGITNRKRVLLKYNIDEELDNGVSLDYTTATTADLNLPIKQGTRLLVPKAKIANLGSILGSLTTEEVNDGKNFNTFISSTLKRLLELPSYKKVFENKNSGNFVDFYPQITVFVWSRVLGQLINISPFIHNVEVNSGGDAATCSISLPPIIGKWENDNWAIDKSTFSGFGLKNFMADSRLFKSNGIKGFKENNFYFHKVISQNDLVFVQMETLEVEKDLRVNDREYTVDYSKLPNRVYDFIGLVDSNSITTNPQSAEIGISISCRDLSKVLIDDGSYFYMEEFNQQLFAVNDGNRDFVNNRLYGRLETFSRNLYRGIEDHIKATLDLFQTTGYVPTDVFSSYPRLTKQVLQNQIDLDNYNSATEGAKELALESIRESRKFYGLTVSKEESQVNSIFNTILNLDNTNTLVVDGEFLTKQAQVALRGTLYKSSRVTSQSVEENEFGDAINNVRSYNQFSKSKPDPNVTSEPLKGIWQIFDVEVDDSIRNIRIFDNSIAEANGSILETIKSVAEEPFMEVFTDTYEDRFKLIARRQPFDSKYYNELKDDSIIIDIEPEVVLNTNLGFSDNEIYSWYYLTPSGLFGGLEEQAAAFLPAVIFPEYVDIYGSRPYQKVTNYSVFYSKKDRDNKVHINLKQAVLDLKYMIDINAYLPFVRSGTITINGDRRIKKKTAIRLKQTGEIFHVDAVQNTYAKSQGIDRTTTLQVSRGMVEKYMDVNRDINYFNIIRTDYKETDFVNLESTFKFDTAKSESIIPDQGGARSQGQTNPYDIVKDWKVNKEVFDFFLNKKQFV